MYEFPGREGVAAICTVAAPLLLGWPTVQRSNVQKGSAEMERKVSDLRPHPKNLTIYGNEELPRDFVENVRVQGILVPLAIKQDGTIISGHRRWRAARAVGMEAVPVEIVSYADELDEREAIIAFNRQREKTFSQKMAEAEELKAIEMERARQRMLMGRKQNPVETLPQGVTGKTRDKVAQAIGLGSGRTYEKAAKIWEAAKQGDPIARKAIAEIDAGQKSINAAYKQTLVQTQLQQQVEALRKEPPPMPKGPFRVIVVDPPWPYGTEYDPVGRRVGSPYPEMSIEELCALKIPAHEDSILWLWTTNAFMRHAYRLLDAWGFQEKTILTWVKDRMGMGTWLRGQTEHCILAVRGKPVITLSNQTTVLHAPVREHSRKPEEFYALVESLCPGSKVELFARTPRRGWAAYGDEIDRFSGIA